MDLLTPNPEKPMNALAIVEENLRTKTGRWSRTWSPVRGRDKQIMIFESLEKAEIFEVNLKIRTAKEAKSGRPQARYRVVEYIRLEDELVVPLKW